MRKPDDQTPSTEAGDGPSFYGRWSRRKAEALRGRPAADGPVPEPPAPGTPPAGPPATSAGADAAEPRVLTDADMPPLDSLGENDDYSGFLSPGVSEALRTRALRKLFASSQFNVRDGLNDYDDDFTTFEPLGDVVTSDMRHRAEVEVERARARAQDEAARERLAARDGGACGPGPAPGDVDPEVRARADGHEEPERDETDDATVHGDPATGPAADDRPATPDSGDAHAHGRDGEHAGTRHDDA